MKKILKFKKIVIATIVALLIILFVVPRVYENQIKKMAPRLLKLNGYTIVHEGEFHFPYQQIDYIVKKDSVIDTVNVQLVHGTLSIQPY